MAENTGISWTTHTFNCWRGCTKISPACTHCYAETLSKRNPLTLGVWGPSGTRVVAAESQWREPVKWNKAAAKAGTRPRVFCASLADVFEDWAGPMVDSRGETLFGTGDSPHWQTAESVNRRAFPGFDPSDPTFRTTMQDVRERLFALIESTPRLDWLLLTKRPENVMRMLPLAWTSDGNPGPLGPTELVGTIPHNVWIGTTVENQEQADRRIPELLKVPAAVRFLSCEPLLGPVDLTRVVSVVGGCPLWHDVLGRRYGEVIGGDVLAGLRVGIDWVITGGESGRDARPSCPDWFASLRDQCRVAGIAYHHKQNGEWLSWGQMTPEQKDACYKPGCETERGDEGAGTHLKPHQMLLSRGESGVGHSMYRVGVKAAGRLLDGVTHDAFPEAAR